jgi:hypothetical protein
MMTMRTKYTHAFRALFLLGIALATVLPLFITAAFPVLGFSLLSSAHAMAAGKTAVTGQALSRCASQPSAQTCTNQDPVTQGCETDAQTLAFKDILDAKGNLLATIQRRYSPSCHSEWGRISDTEKEPVQIVVNKQERSTEGSVVYSVMVFVPNLSVAPEIIGTVSLTGMNPAHSGVPGLAGILPALPSAPILP